jgi:two-component sensor histidine kinase
VANSLQIIASVLMQSARKVQSEEARTHLNDAHHRATSIASLQRQLAEQATGAAALRRIEGVQKSSGYSVGVMVMRLGSAIIETPIEAQRSAM